MDDRATTAHGTRETVRGRMIEPLTEMAHTTADRVRDDAISEDDPRIESVAFVERQVALEDEGGVQRDPLQIPERNRFGEIVGYIASRVEAPA